jgi:hypothetical protein
MADKNEKVRGGGKFTFILAFLAFVMSGTSLYQQNQMDIKVKFHEMQLALNKLKGSLSDTTGILDIRGQISDAMGEFMIEENREETGAILGDMVTNLSKFIKHLNGEDADPALISEAESIKQLGEEALNKLNEAETDISGELRDMFHRVKNLQSTLSGEE